MTKIAIVTGGIRGIGAATSIALKDAGYLVIANYRKNEELARNFTKEHGIKTMMWNVANLEECYDNVAKIAKEFGTTSILINNAGITRDSMMHKIEPTMWSEVINTNLSSCFNMCKAVINDMRKQEYGRIVNISSVNALLGQMGQTNYSAAKSGIIGFSKALARESAVKNITVNTIAPGYIATDMMKSVPDNILEGIVNAIPMQRLGQPEEIARAVLFLVSEDAGFITGETLSINGGQHMN
ncbi:MAG: 3-oxoacyl-ACP reductase [Rickettsiaceae bacterium]|nr:3-oxoacyl-ACP reductase [Rickettsiaceae bacterium]